MLAGLMYRHMSCLDLDMLVCGKVFTTNEEYQTLIVRWYHRTLKCYITERGAVSVRRKDFWKWQKAS